MKMLEVAIFAKRGMEGRSGSESCQARLSSALPARSRGAKRRWRRRHWRAGSIARSASPPKPAAKKSGHECVAGTKHVEDFDRKAVDQQPVVRLRSEFPPGRRRSPRRPACRPARRRCARRTARSALMVSSLPPRIWISSSVPTIRSQEGRTDCNRSVTVGRGDEAVFAEVLAGQAPQHRAIVDIEDDFAAAVLCDFDRLQSTRRKRKRSTDACR